MAKENNKCSFCGREKRETNLLIAGMEGFICDYCVQQANTIVSEELTDKQSIVSDKIKVQKPSEIKEYLDQYVIGQEDAKKVISVAVYNHYKRLTQKKDTKNDDVEIEKSNIVLVGETGTGKTLIARTIAKMLNVPFCIADATVFTEAGYVGEDVETILTRLLQAADYNLPNAEKGIVFIDEIDKISRKQDNPSITRDVSGEGVQQALLKLIEGAVVNVPPQGGRKHPEQKMIAFNTANVLFICGGAFDGIEPKIARRLQTHVIGYATGTQKDVIDRANMVQYVSPQDLRSFGLIPELVGRLPVVSYLSPLDKESLRRILTEPKNALVKQYVKLFEMDNIKLTIDDNALDFIVDKAVEFKLGARGLRSICEAIMVDAMYTLPGTSDVRTFHLSLEYAHEKLDKSSIQKLKVA
ncbi:MAG: ATP-dependent Clp protease ATP-binding subunit ClpX [Bacteroidota bacterium]